MVWRGVGAWRGAGGSGAGGAMLALACGARVLGATGAKAMVGGAGLCAMGFGQMGGAGKCVAQVAEAARARARGGQPSISSSQVVETVDAERDGLETSCPCCSVTTFGVVVVLPVAVELGWRAARGARWSRVVGGCGRKASRWSGLTSLTALGSN